MNLEPGQQVAAKSWGYKELLKPRIVFLNLIVAVAGMFLAWGTNVVPTVLVLTLVTGGIGAAGASTINGYLDRDIDAVMVRTKLRPIAAGHISPATKALYLGVILVVVSLLASGFLINWLTSFFIGLGVAFYVIVYTLWLKRRSVYNIVIGGFAGSCSGLAGWAAASNSIGIPAILLALLIFLWTPGHFWPLALRFKADYARANIPMLPVIMGEEKTVRIIATSNFLTVAFAFTFYFFSSVGLVYLTIAALLGGLMVMANIKLLKQPTSKEAWKVFKFSNIYLLLILIGLVVGSVLSVSL